MTSGLNVTKIFLALLAGVAMAAQPTQSGSAFASPSKPRIVVTADPELDDSNSMVRFLLYSSDYNVEGLIYASSQYHWKGDGKGKTWFVAGRQYTRNGRTLCPCTSWRWEDHFIHDAVEAYEKAYPNLKAHHPDYPAPAYLKSIIRYGNIEFEGEMSRDTPGSEWIKQKILDPNPGPLYITAWGGASTIARALKSIQEQYEGTVEWAPLQDKISKKVILLFSGDQDNTDARYIRPNWPNIPHGISGGWSGVPLAYNAQRNLMPQDAAYYSAKWEQENISSKGPIGAFWRVWGDGKQMTKGDIFDYFGLAGYTDEQVKAMGYDVWTPQGEKGSFLGEGDSGTFMPLLNTGLRMTVRGAAASPAMSAAGRGAAGAAQGGRGPVTTETMYRSAMAGGPPRQFNPDFIPAVWNDFAARMEWAVTPAFKDANHRPTVEVQGHLDISARPGETVSLAATTSDPDRNAVTVKWWHYKSAGTYPGEIKIVTPAALNTSFEVPADAQPGATIHVIVEATDNGTPPLTHYQHVVVTVQGSAGPPGGR
jgi:hypothetical protein